MPHVNRVQREINYPVSVWGCGRHHPCVAGIGLVGYSTRASGTSDRIQRLTEEVWRSPKLARSLPPGSDNPEELLNAMPRA